MNASDSDSEKAKLPCWVAGQSQKPSPMSCPVEVFEPTLQGRLPWQRPSVIGKSGRADGRAEAGQDQSRPLLPCHPGESIDPRGQGRGGGRGSEGLSRPWQVELPYPNRSGNRHQRHGGGAHYLSQEAKDYVGAVRRRLERAQLADLRLAGPYVLEMVLQPPTARARDGDNVEKVVLDALVKGGLLADDNNSVLPVVIRYWVDAEKPGRILLTAKEKL